jgi:prophage maintenance system killer protein
MNRLGYLNQTAIDTYGITPVGEDAIEETRFEDGYVNIREELELDYSHVAELEEVLDAETFVEINKTFYRDSGAEYEIGENTMADIESIRDSRLERLAIEFPRFEPLANQLAHAVRTFCGYHPFPDANHRTGTYVAHILATKHGYNLFELYDKDSDGINRAAGTSKILRGLCSNAREGVDQLWIKDELFYHWNRYFRDLLYDVNPQKRVHTITGECQYERLISNRQVDNLLRFAVLDSEEMAEALDAVQEN